MPLDSARVTLVGDDCAIFVCGCVVEVSCMNFSELTSCTKDMLVFWTFGEGEGYQDRQFPLVFNCVTTFQPEISIFNAAQGNC